MTHLACLLHGEQTAHMCTKGKRLGKFLVTRGPLIGVLYVENLNYALAHHKREYKYKAFQMLIKCSGLETRSRQDIE